MIESPRKQHDPLSIVSEATLKQREASDPSVSSWVGASAGSGKTKVLTDRMLRLLLPRENGMAGTKPEKILALTFTKAAANEMALRLSRRLSSWAVMSDADLSGDMNENLLGRNPSPKEMEEARKLFAHVVDAPGGLKIMTIHSFCQSVLGRFPVEAGLAPNFKALEEEQAQELLITARKHVLSQARQSISSPLARAIENIGTLMSEDQFASVLSSMMGERHQMQQVLKRSFGVEGLYTNLCSLFEIQPGTTEEMAYQDVCSSENINEAGLSSLCAVLAASKSGKDQDKAVTIQLFLDCPFDKRIPLYSTYRSIFLTAKGELQKSLATKAITDFMPDAEWILKTEGLRLIAFEDLLKTIVCSLATRDLFLLGEAIFNKYQDLKSRQGALDFDDLILKTLSLFKGIQAGTELASTSWIMHKLDEGLDHILVDEAQDTNPEQWDIIRLLSDDFFNGIAAQDYVRSIFVVGDEKQSIFSFQRAAPEKFNEMYRWFEKKIQQSGEKFAPVNINTSFRSVQAVLDAVDSVFAQPHTVRGLGDQYLSHIAKRQGQGGLVEVWPLFQTQTGEQDNDEDEDSADSGWFTPTRLIESKSGSSQMAARIADTIRGWIDQKEMLASYNRPIHAGDIMILVRSRNAFVGQMVRALKTRKIPVSGVDRLVLADQIIVQDLCAAAAFALLPEDDLTLASLLKSPFLGIGEEALYTLAQGRTGSLWQKIKENGPSDILCWLEKLISHAGADHPYEFFSRIVQEPCPHDSVSGMRAIRKRLGEDAFDPLEEFLNTALTYESSHSAGLQGFLKWHQDISSEIKRQMEEGGKAVRIMTVHGAKGLQSPIVFLPDTVRVGAGQKDDKIYWPHKTGMDLPLYIPSKETSPALASAAQAMIQEKADEEYRRLLYVAMTRAEERLYIGGYTGKRKPGEDSKTAYWYQDIRSAFERRDGVERIDSGLKDSEGRDLPILRVSAESTQPPDKADKAGIEKTRIDAPLPPWIFASAPEEPSPPRPLVPSRPSGAEPAAASPLEAGTDFRFKRGTVTHKLMQILPDLPQDRRRIAADRFLARAGLGLPPVLQKQISDEVMVILNDPGFKDIFGEGSMAEVPITGFLASGVLISGQIDRLLVRENDVLIVDYKTNRPPPQDAADVPAVYIQQMKAYADTLSQIYPGKTIRCALLWTDGARLMEVAL